MNARGKPGRPGQAKAPPRVDLPDVTRSIPPTTKQALIAAAAGRCEFLGCNRYLFAHHVTKRVGYFGNYAHIRAFSPGGPRAGGKRRAGDVHDSENLMLLCRECHVLVDLHPADFSVAKLRRWKREHEGRVAYLLELPVENETSVIEVWTSVANPPVVRNQAKIVGALLPLYPSKARHCLIDLAEHDLSTLAVIPAARESIDRQIAQLFAPGAERPTHVAVFGMTNIPLLVHLGAKLGDRQDAHLFQYHRDTKDWRWKKVKPRARFGVRRLRTGTDPMRVALLLSVSGTIDRAALPPELAGWYLYEIRLTSDTPHLGCLRSEGDLERFRATYRKFLSRLQAEHGALAKIAVIPAVPIPIAVAVGMDRLPKIGPAIDVYDLDRSAPGGGVYRLALRVA